MSTKTIKQDIKPALSISSSIIELIATFPEDIKKNKKAPISLTLSTKEDDQNNNNDVSLKCYYYSLPSHRNNNDIVGTCLLDTNDDFIRDITRQLSTIIAKKFGNPCYVAWGVPNSAIDGFQLEQLTIVKECIDFLSKQLTI